MESHPVKDSPGLRICVQNLSPLHHQILVVVKTHDLDLRVVFFEHGSEEVPGKVSHVLWRPHTGIPRCSEQWLILDGDTPYINTMVLVGSEPLGKIQGPRPVVPRIILQTHRPRASLHRHLIVFINRDLHPLRGRPRTGKDFHRAVLVFSVCSFDERYEQGCVMGHIAIKMLQLKVILYVIKVVGCHAEIAGIYVHPPHRITNAVFSKIRFQNFLLDFFWQHGPIKGTGLGKGPTKTHHLLELLTGVHLYKALFAYCSIYLTPLEVKWNLDHVLLFF
mmetsp:Transcript_22744/g.33008  ORF Transcript_22744/g.33008 Transcript_22744/m.33008 type:complete len:277 (-) Transcript_22744:274-1104(-)